MAARMSGFSEMEGGMWFSVRGGLRGVAVHIVRYSNNKDAFRVFKVHLFLCWCWCL